MRLRALWRRAFRLVTQRRPSGVAMTDVQDAVRDRGMSRRHCLRYLELPACLKAGFCFHQVDNTATDLHRCTTCRRHTRPPAYFFHFHITLPVFIQRRDGYRACDWYRRGSLHATPRRGGSRGGCPARPFQEEPSSEGARPRWHYIRRYSRQIRPYTGATAWMPSRPGVPSSIKRRPRHRNTRGNCGLRKQETPALWCR